jgi:hypothetical protein
MDSCDQYTEFFSTAQFRTILTIFEDIIADIGTAWINRTQSRGQHGVRAVQWA